MFGHVVLVALHLRHVVDSNPVCCAQDEYSTRFRRYCRGRASELGRHYIYRNLVARVWWFGIDDHLVAWGRRENTDSAYTLWIIICLSEERDSCCV
jgi:hypothetical protein